MGPTLLLHPSKKTVFAGGEGDISAPDSALLTGSSPKGGLLSGAKWTAASATCCDVWRPPGETSPFAIEVDGVPPPTWSAYKALLAAFPWYLATGGQPSAVVTRQELPFARDCQYILFLLQDRACLFGLISFSATLHDLMYSNEELVPASRTRRSKLWRRIWERHVWHPAGAQHPALLF